MSCGLETISAEPEANRQVYLLPSHAYGRGGSAEM